MESPSFIIIPKQVFKDKRIQHLDCILYGHIYWLSRMKDEVGCIASNDTLAAMMGCTSTSIQASLLRLEQAGYIQRRYDQALLPKRVRKEIVPLVDFQVQAVFVHPQLKVLTPAVEGARAPSVEGENNSIKKEKLDSIRRVFDAYRSDIQPNARALSDAMKKIGLRLKTYSEKELIEAVQHFKANGWWMANNADRGAHWFFHSDRRIEQFLNIKPEKRDVVINLNEK